MGSWLGRPAAAATGAGRVGAGATASDVRASGVDLPAVGLRIPVWTDPVTADLGGRESDRPHANWWWLGVHGGAGLSTLAAAVAGGADANRRWPDPAKGGPRAVVLVGRSSPHGLRCLRGALRQHAAGGVPAGLHVVGVAVVAHQPGRLPHPLAQEVLMLTGIAPTVWQVPWLTEFLDHPDPVFLPLPAQLRSMDADLGCLRPAGAPPSLRPVDQLTSTVAAGRRGSRARKEHA